MIDGIINIYKEKGYTSHDVVAKLRGILHQKKIGHTGTLDPDAEGVLPVCLGKATKLCDMLTEKTKEYEAEMLLGKVTDTQDLSGTVLQEKEVNVSKEEVEEAILSFCGEQQQIPPMYSALKVNGKRLYELARAGVEVERKPRQVTFYEIEILSMELPKVRIRVKCSKGTYIRTLCHDIGQKIGCGACMSSLLRTKSGEFEISDSLKLNQVEILCQEEKIQEVILPIENMFLNLNQVEMIPEYENMVWNGNPFLLRHIKRQNHIFLKDEEIRVYVEKNKFIGIYRFDALGQRFVPVKMFIPE